MTGTDWTIQDTSRPRKIGAALLVMIGGAGTLLWLWLSSYSPSLLFDLLLLFCGPFLLGLAIWSLWTAPLPRDRISLSDKDITVWPDSRKMSAVVFRWEAIDTITFSGGGRGRRVAFQDRQNAVKINASVLAATETEILRRIALKVENLGKSLAEDISPVLGAKTGVWRITDRTPFG